MGSSSEKIWTSPSIPLIALIPHLSSDPMSASFLFSRAIPKSTGGLQEFLGPGDGEGEQGLEGGDLDDFNYDSRVLVPKSEVFVDPAREEYLTNLRAPLASPVCSQWDQLFTQNFGRSSLKVQFRNRGKEFAVALESEGKKRIELTDCLGRKHVLEETVHRPFWREEDDSNRRLWTYSRVIDAGRRAATQAAPPRLPGRRRVEPRRPRVSRQADNGAIHQIQVR